VTLTTPQDDAIFSEGVDIGISADASDSDGAVVLVEFYDAAVKIGEDNSVPYELLWSGAAAGVHSLSAKAFDDMGAATTSSTVNVTVTDGTPPAAPSGISAAAVSDTQINLDWADNGESDLSHYEVSRAATSGGAYSVIALTGLTSSYSDTGLSASTYYYYVVKAVDVSDNESGYSPEASATTHAEPDTTPPDAPTGLTAEAMGEAQIDLNWADNDDSDLSHYNVYRAQGEGGPYMSVASDLTDSSYSDMGLTASTTYYYVVRAVDTSNNESGNSSVALARTDDPSQLVVSVSNVSVTIILDKKYWAKATITLTPTLEGATVVGDWYFKGALRQSGATADVSGGTATVPTSFTTPGKSGDVFEFVVTNVIEPEYIFVPSPNDSGADAI